MAPPALPEHLAWFKWEAYTTWLSGFGLMVVLYYFERPGAADRPGGRRPDARQAVGISVGLLAAAWLVYDGLCRRDRVTRARWRRHRRPHGAAAWACSELFAPRAAFLQVGAMLGTIMAGNVLFNIIPAHWELIRAKQEGREPDPQPALVAKQRSVHNNYLTLPVLLTMLAGHVAFLYEVERPWLVLFALMLLGAWARLFFNLRHTGRTIWTIPAVGIAAVVGAGSRRRAERRRREGVDPGGGLGGQRGLRRAPAAAPATPCRTRARRGQSGRTSTRAGRRAPAIVAVVTSGSGVMPAFRNRRDAAADRRRRRLCLNRWAGK